VIVLDHTKQGHFVPFDRDAEEIVGMKASQLAQKVVEVKLQITKSKRIMSMVLQMLILFVYYCMHCIF
jgi:hypothetical protein